MRWIRVLGGLAVLSVIGLGLGTLASLAVANDLLLASSVRAPALASLAVLVAAFLLTLFAANPASDWLDNPYW